MTIDNFLKEEPYIACGSIVRLKNGDESLDNRFVYFGKIPNMTGHCVVLNIKTKEMDIGYHYHDFEIVPDDEV